jgi:hypothetical protein
MEKDKEHLIQLILEDINDMISEKDKILLYDRIADDQDAFQLYMEMHEELDSPEVRRGIAMLSGIDQSKTLKDFFIKKVRTRWAALIAILLVKMFFFTILGAILYRSYINKQLRTTQPAIGTPAFLPVSNRAEMHTTLFTYDYLVSFNNKAILEKDDLVIK